MDVTPLVTVVFLTRNAGQEFRGVLRAVLRQKTSFSFEVLAIDNQSTDGTWRTLGEFSKIRRFRIKRREFLHGPTRNKAMGIARGKVVVFLVQDAMPVGNRWLETLVKPLTEGKEKRIAGVSGRQVPPADISLSQQYFLMNSYPSRPKMLSRVPKEFGPGKIWFTNVCSAISKEVWQKVKFPNVIMSEDQGWAREVLNQGWKLVYEPKARVLHGHKLSLPNLFRRMVDSGASLASINAPVPAASGSFLEHLRGEMEFAYKKVGIPGVFSVLAYEITRWIGFQIGYRKFIPWQIKKSLSNLPWWYAERTD